MMTAIDEVLEASESAPLVEERARELFLAERRAAMSQADRVFLYLMLAQWAFGIAIALTVSPYSWEGKVQSVHLHVRLAVLLGGALSSLPIALAILRPGDALTRHVMAAAQVLWSALLIHLTGGRIETHFHVFVSLAFLAFYQDWTILITATVVVAADHFLRGLLWPESVYGIINPQWWRFVEHAAWVVFEDVVLIAWCLKGTAALRQATKREAQLEVVSQITGDRMAALEMAMSELSGSHPRPGRTVPA
jgi:two-component system, NtrC family, sensor histidine kinase HydH